MFEVMKAEREGTPALIALWGPSNSGKTYSALLLARGLVGNGGKIVVVDTENKRAKFYAGMAGGWLHLDLQPPFTPQRYTTAMEAAEKAGAGCIIIDSASHVWEGEGGVLDMADAGGKKGLQKWQAPKIAYKRMMNALLRSRVHVIFCLRAKEKMVQMPDGTIVSAGMVPIAEKNFIYEMTVSLQLGPDHAPVTIKAPEDLLPALPASSAVTIQTGEKITEWVGGGKPVDQDMMQLQRRARNAAMDGREAFGTFWKDISPAQRKQVQPILEECRSLCEQAERKDDDRDVAADDNPLADAGPADDNPLADDAPPVNGNGHIADEETDRDALIAGARRHAENGRAALDAHLNALSKEQRDVIGEEITDLLAQAEEADERKGKTAKRQGAEQEALV